jgi:uncharacterized caspase-like protein
VERFLVDPNLCGYPRANVRRLLDKEATRARIVEELEKLRDEATEEDTVIVYFSGHGGRTPGTDAEGIICPVDYDPADRTGTSIATRELSALIETIPAARVVVILDSCHSEAAAQIKDAESGKGILSAFRSNDLERLAEGVGRVILASCREDEVSFTYVEKGHSYFTYHLLEGLRGKAKGGADGLVRIFDLFAHLAEEVPKRVIDGRSQHPVIRAHAEDNFPVALRQGGILKSADSEVAQAPEANHDQAGVSQSVIDTKALESILVALYPLGPLDNSVWSRAGGDLSSLHQASTGRAAWHAALKLLKQGGGGSEMSLMALVSTALEDFPNNIELRGLKD